MLLLSLSGLAGGQAHGDGSSAMYYCVSSREVLFWPAASWNAYSFVRSDDKKWRAMLPKEGVLPAVPVSPQILIQQLKQFGDCEQSNTEQWRPDAELYSVKSGGESHWGIIIRDKFDASDTDSIPPKHGPSTEALRDTIGQLGITALERSGGPFPDSAPWLESGSTNFKVPRAVVYRATDGGLHWILEERISQAEWEARTYGLSRGLKSRPEFSNPPSSAAPLVPSGSGNSVPSEDAARVTYLVFLVLIIALPAGWASHILYLRVRRKRLPSVTVPPNGSIRSLRDSGLLRTAEVIVEELTKNIGKASAVGPDAKFHKSVLEWAGQQYKSHLSRIPDGSIEGQEIAQSIQHRVFQEAFRTQDPQETGDLVELGRNSREALRVICESPFEAKTLRAFQQNKKRLRELVLELPKLLEQVDIELLAAKKRVTELEDWMRINQREIAESGERQRVIEERERDIKTLQGERERLSQLKNDLDGKLLQVVNGKKKLDETLSEARYFNSIASSCAAGKRSFLSHSGRIQAASALAFLIDYSLFNAVQAILSGNRRRALVMRENLRRISEKGKNKGIAGFDPEIFGPPESLDLQLHESDRHPDRPLFADTLKALREFGDLHMHFDFDVDEAGVYRVR
jgi:hypothetical protein